MEYGSRCVVGSSWQSYLTDYLGSQACFTADIDVHHVICVGLTGPLQLDSLLTGQASSLPFGLPCDGASTLCLPFMVAP